MRGCRHETFGPDLGGHRQACGPDTQENPIEVVCQRIQNEDVRVDSKSSARFSIFFCSATSRSCEGACLNNDVSDFDEHRETIEVVRHQQSTFPRNSPETHVHPTSEIWRRQSWQIGQEHCTELKMLLTPDNLIM